MAYVTHTPNPFEPYKVQQSSIPMGGTVQSWVDLNFPEDFPNPTVCICNGKPLLREQWNQIVGPDDVVCFVAVTGAFGLVAALVIAAVAIAASLVVALTLPSTPGNDALTEPVFSLRGQKNDIRIGEPIECPYGRNRVYPSVAARAWYQYINNDQFQHSLLCIGQGYYDVDTVSIGDSDITSFEDVDYEIVPPGGEVTLFPTAVYSSTEVGTIEVYAPNEDEYPVDGWIGPFVTNASGTVATKIEFDFVFPEGVYWMKQSGSVRFLQLAFEVEIREIDDAGSPIGSWTQIKDVDVWWAYTNPQRITYTYDLESNVGRYEIRVKRTSSYLAGHPRVGGKMIWEGLRAHLDEEQDWGDVTLLAVKARATNNLNSTSAQKFNVICTRKLPIYDTGTQSWLDPTATRSIVWAFCDVLRSAYGANLVDTYLDLDTLAEMADFYESTERTEYFDWIFRDPITVWEALQTIARVGRAVPIVKGSQVSIVRNGPLSVPVAMFTPDNIIAGTFRMDLKMWQDDEYDSVNIEYTEPSTGYQQETVVAGLPGGTTDRPEDIRFPGIQDRDHAYREGLFIVGRRRYIRWNASFETGLEGHIPIFGDLIAVSHDVPRWQQSGYIVDAEYQTGGEWLVTLSEPLNWDDTGAHVMLLQDVDGTVLGPTPVEEVAGEPQQALLTQPGTDDPDFRLGGTKEPMLFIFGTPGEETRYLRVVKVEPSGEESVKITGEPEVDLVHTLEDDTSAVPDALPTTSYPSAPSELPEVTSLTLTQLDLPTPTVQVSWPAVVGASYYVLQTSEDNLNWTTRSTSSQVSQVVGATYGTYYVRVAAVGSGGQGPWESGSVSVTQMTLLETSIPWDDIEWEVRWWDVVNAAGFVVKLYDNSTTEPTLIKEVQLAVGTLSYQYDIADAEADGVITREMLVSVDALFENEEDASVLEASGNPVELELSNSMPREPYGLSASFVEIDTDNEAVYDLSWTNPTEDDLVRVKVWVSDDPDFDPATEAPIVDDVASAIGHANIISAATISWPLNISDEHPTLYWRVGVFDVWGNEVNTSGGDTGGGTDGLGNVSERDSIPAYS